MILELEDCGFIFLELLILFVDLADSYSDHIDHVTKNGSSNYLNHCGNDNLDIVTGKEITVSDCHHGGIGPVIRVDVELIPRFS